MVFKFKELAEVQNADSEWRNFSTSIQDGVIPHPYTSIDLLVELYHEFMDFVAKSNLSSADIDQDLLSRCKGVMAGTVVESEPEEEESAEGGWRRLALQFDGHRMQALGHIRALLKDSLSHHEAAEKFLAAGPLSGEEVLAERIKALAAVKEK